MAENNTTSQAAVKTESSPISSKPNTASRTSSKANPSSRIPVSSSSTSSNTSNISAADSEWIADRVLELINAERTKLGCIALSTAPKAHEIATVRAQQLTTFLVMKMNWEITRQPFCTINTSIILTLQVSSQFMIKMETIKGINHMVPAEVKI